MSNTKYFHIKIAGLFLIIFTMLFFLSGGAFGQEKPKSAELSREAAWKLDLDSLAEQLPTKHKNLFFKISKEEFFQKIEGLKASLNGLNDDEIKVEMMKIIASVGDSHTQLDFKSERIFPLKFYCYQDGIFLILTTEEYSDYLHQKLIQINDTDIDELKKRLSAVIPHENEAQLEHRFPNYLFRTDILYGLNIIPDKYEARFIFEDENKGRTEAVIRSMSIKENPKPVGLKTDLPLPLYLKNQKKYYWSEYLEEPKLLYFKYNYCANMPGQPITKFIKDLFGFIDDHPVQKMVVDMRDNGGGNSSLLMPLINKLKNHQGINQKGSLFVVVGRRTFSSAILNVLSFKDDTEAIFIGEPTGGRPNHYGEIKRFILKNSGIQVQYSTKYFSFAKEDTPSFIPDIVLKLSMKDYLNRRDPVMEYILKY